MNNLLDTHTFIWFVNGDNKLSEKAKKAIEHRDAINYLSIVSLWEIAIKISVKKLSLNFPFFSVEQQIIKNGFIILPISINDTLLLSQMPFHHNDPFDRIIIAQAQNNNLNLISKDTNFGFYNVNLIW